MFRIFTDPNKRGLWVLLIVIAALVLLVFWLNSEARADTPNGDQVIAVDFKANTEEQADKMIQHWIRDVKWHPMTKAEKRKRFAAFQVEATKEYGTPLSLTMAMMFRESSCRPKPLGKKGEIGLMQVHPDTAKNFRCKMETPRGQVVCGHRVLARGFDKCQTWRGALTYYAGNTGRCKARPGSRLAWVVKDRFKLAAELERIAR